MGRPPARHPLAASGRCHLRARSQLPGTRAVSPPSPRPETAPTPPAVRDDTAAVVVTHEPRGDFAARLATLARGVGRTWVVDNASGAATWTTIEQAIARAPRTEGIRSPHNRGIGWALNVAAERARHAGYRWLLTLDQDSRTPPGFAAALHAWLPHAPEPDRSAVLAPLHHDPARREPPPRLERPRTTTHVMTSGNLVRLEALEQIGGWNEQLFIDMVDHEICWRLWDAGWQVVEVPVILPHSVGAVTVCELAGRRFRTTNHAVWRRYMIARNLTWLAVRHLRRRPRCVTGELRAVARELLKALLAEPRPIEKLLRSTQGVIDGLRARLGPPPFGPASRRRRTSDRSRIQLAADAADLLS
ncbi:MAG: glycosyltransferase [Planctomycetota bacterium]|nr:MAG: glycosyltransferase [Planctomycetota bacterium]